MITALKTRIRAFVVLVALCSGCVATSDLERLDRDLSQKMDAASSMHRDDLASIRDSVEQVQASQDALRGDLTASVEGLRTETRDALTQLAVDEQKKAAQLKELDSQIAKTRQALTDYVKTNVQTLEQIGQATRDVNMKLAAIEKSIATVQGLPPAVSELGTELRALRQTLQQTYRLEEAALRHRLEALEELTRQLDSNGRQAKKSE